MEEREAHPFNNEPDVIAPKPAKKDKKIKSKPQVDQPDDVIKPRVLIISDSAQAKIERSMQIVEDINIE